MNRELGDYSPYKDQVEATLGLESYSERLKTTYVNEFVTFIDGCEKYESESITNAIRRNYRLEDYKNDFIKEHNLSQEDYKYNPLDMLENIPNCRARRVYQNKVMYC